MRTAVATGVALVLLAAGCASEEGSADAPEATRSATGAPQDPTETPTESPSESPSETSTAKPVTGPVMEVQGITVQLPKGYDVGFDNPVVATAGGELGVVVLSAIAGEPWSVDRLAKEEIKASGPMQTVRRHPDTTLDGLAAYHYSGRLDRHTFREVYGTWDSGYQVIVRFELHDFMRKAKRRELIESVVATYDSPSS